MTTSVSKKKLSDVFLRNLLNSETWPADKDQLFVTDVQTPGLILEIKRRKKGVSALWRFRYKHQAKPYLMSLGKYPFVSLADARKKVHDARSLLNDGINPIEARKEEQQAKPVYIFESLANDWMASQEKIWSERYSRSVRQRLQNNIFPPMGKKDINSLTLKDIQLALDIIINRNSYETARRVCELILQVLVYARTIKVLEDRDLIYDLKEYKTKVMPRHDKKNYPTITDPQELGKLLLALEEDAPQKGTYSVYMACRLAPYVFLRAGELCGLRWDEVDLEREEITIDGSRMKAGYTHIVPLPTQAIKLLREMYEYSGGMEYVFPRHRNLKEHIVTDSLRMVLKRLGYSHKFTTHSWRSVASTLLNGGIDDIEGIEVPLFHPQLIEIQLAHVEKDEVKAAYYRVKDNPRVRLKERRQMMQIFADLLDFLRTTARNNN